MKNNGSRFLQIELIKRQLRKFQKKPDRLVEGEILPNC